MKNNKGNLWLQDSNQVDNYVNSAGTFLIERKRTIKLLFDLFTYFFKDYKNLEILDLGCGDGIITEYFFNKYPHNAYTLLDGSQKMLGLAKNRFNSENFTFINQSFEEYIIQTENEQKYHFIFSANAIHHLDLHNKSLLYEKIFKELKFNGLFLNTDPVLPLSDLSEQWQFKMWSDWINENQILNSSNNNVGKYDDLPAIYKNKSENKPSTLFDQMNILNKIGFRNVDCYYKYSIFSLFGGTK